MTPIWNIRATNATPTSVALGRTWSVWLLTATLVIATGTFAAAQNGSGNQITDAAITRAVDTDLMIDPGVSAHLIDVRTAQGIVTLSGTVDNLLSKERATLITKSIRGVRAVVDNMTVKPTTRSDSQIRSDIERALLRDPATDSYQVKAQVKNGVATLKGKVDSWQEKQLSEEVVKGVRGVTGVVNEITWTWAGNRLDSEIQADIERRLQSDIWVDHGLINVKVIEGKVSLSGTVGSTAEKGRAGTDAWVAGVKEVNTDALTVNPYVQDVRQRKTPVAVIKSDAAVAEAIRTAFLYDPRVFSFNPTVEVDNGVATLTGVVDNLRAKQAAGQDAENTLGVWRVHNLLKVRPANPPADADIAKEVREALDTSPFVDRFDVVVRVVNQKAYLSGLADSFFEKSEAANIAAGIPGVVEVENNLNLRTYPYAYPHWNYYSHYNRPVMLNPPEASRSADWRIKRNIESQLFWSPYVNDDQIIVTVTDGVATLRGTVDSRMERGAAIDNAYQGGARSVENELKVNGEPTS